MAQHAARQRDTGAILRTLDVDAFCAATGCPRESALNAMHKSRYEIADMPAELRHASRAWLEAHGHDRYLGQPWPPAGVLPA